MKLSSPIKIGQKTCKNRIMMPPLVCFNWADENGLETVSRSEHYGKRSDAETGFIVIEAAGISKESRIIKSEIGIWSEDHLEQYRKIAERCHQNNTLVVVQIVHAGLKAYADTIYAPSFKDVLDKTVKVLTIEEIDQIKDEFVTAAKLAKQVGLDGIEVHGAHYYLLNQFTSPITNTREDHYGGSVENRFRLAVDVVKAIRLETGDDFIISYRYGVNDPTFKEDTIGVKLLEAAGVDLFNVSAGIGIKSLDVPPDYPASFITYMGYKIKQVTSKPVVSVFDIRDPELARELIENDYTDMVAIGRGLLADPEWSKKALNNESINRCYHCKPRCQYLKDGHKCPWRKHA